MEITFNRKTALFITRVLRARRAAPSTWGQRVELIAPDPFPGKRFTRKLFELSCLGLGTRGAGPESFDVAVPGKEVRLRAKGVRNTVYGSEQSIPPRSFIEVQPGVAISCPELLFLEMANELSLFEHLMLGYELCGTFSRDPHDPVEGDGTFWCRPATSCEKIEAYLRKVKWQPGTERAQKTLSLLSDNAWSPTESLISAIASLPYEEFGYGMGPCILNRRVSTAENLRGAVVKDTRVPDILFEGTPVGLNYDGAVHLDLDSVVRAAMEVERNPGQMASQQGLDAVVRDVRAKAIDDIRRNRELAAAGYIVFPVVKEDLYEDGALDTVMLQVMETIENLTGADLGEQKRLLGVGFCRDRRQQLIRSFLSGSRRHGQGSQQSAEPQQIVEVMVGF